MNNLHVAIIGAGATGVAAFIALVRQGACKRITLLDASGPAIGQVYASQHPELLCNTSVELMSLLPPHYHDLLHYLHEHTNNGITLADFVSRKIIGDYIQDRYTRYLSLAYQQGISVSFIRDAGKQVMRQPGGDYLIETRQSGTITADAVIVCTGYTHPAIPEALVSYQGDPLFFASPYPEKLMLEKIRPDSHVLIVGTRLSAIDAALVLCRQGCRVSLVSPSGDLPAVRSAVMLRPIQASRLAWLTDSAVISEQVRPDIRKWVIRLLAHASAISLREQFVAEAESIQRLRRESELARQDKTEWQYRIVGMINAINQHSHTLPEAVKHSLSAFLRATGRYISAMPLKNAEKLLSYVDSGLLSVEKLRADSLQKSDSGWTLSNPQGEITHFDALVCATGYAPPRHSMTHNGLILADARDASAAPPRLNNHLQLHLTHRVSPESVWLAGISTHLSVPVVNALFVAVEQVNRIAQQIKRL